MKKILAILISVVLLAGLTVGAYAFISNVTGGEPTPLTLRYDDRYTFPMAIENIETVSVTSRVSGTNTPDAQVLARKDALDRDVAVAVGVGQAKVTLKDGSEYLVTVTPAPISVLLLIGQSNAEGSTTGDADVYRKARNQSIVCEEGQIYSTYAWSTTGHSTYCAGLASSNKLTTSNAASFTAASLTSNLSRAGSALEYPLNTLTENGIGKTGIDSGLAWSWHQQTGEKVWVVNCAAGSTAIEVWQPSQVRYENCVALMNQVGFTLKEEIAAGHYTLRHFLYFWLQGESNKSTSEEEYSAMLEAMHTELKEQLSVGGKSLEGMGIIMVRAFQTSNPSIDTVDNGPRAAQKAAAAATTGVFADAFMACDVNDQWISPAGVTDYWAAKYPGSVYPFRSHAQAYQNPVTIGEVHNGVHYLQPGYNEIGIVAAATAASRLAS